MLCIFRNLKPYVVNGEDAAMTAAELYTQFEIQPAEYNPAESPFEFAKRVVMSHQMLIEQTGVNYSSGTNNSGLNNDQANNYVMYSY